MPVPGIKSGNCAGHPNSDGPQMSSLCSWLAGPVPELDPGTSLTSGKRRSIAAGVAICCPGIYGNCVFKLRPEYCAHARSPLLMPAQAEGTGEESPTELAAGTSMEAATGVYIAQLCGELAQMAAKAELNGLALLLFSAQIEAELWAHASEDKS
jgi:hypothetical protein